MPGPGTRGRDATADAVRVVVETGTKRVFASALDWPGWSRGARDERGALEALLAYAPRYSDALKISGVRGPSGKTLRAGSGALDVAERVKGNGGTDSACRWSR